MKLNPSEIKRAYKRISDMWNTFMEFTILVWRLRRGAITHLHPEEQARARTAQPTPEDLKRWLTRHHTRKKATRLSQPTLALAYHTPRRPTSPEDTQYPHHGEDIALREASAEVEAKEPTPGKPADGPG